MDHLEQIEQGDNEIMMWEGLLKERLQGVLAQLVTRHKS